MNNYEYNELLKLGSLLQAKNELDPEIKKLDDLKYNLSLKKKKEKKAISFYEFSSKPLTVQIEEKIIEEKNNKRYIYQPKAEKKHFNHTGKLAGYIELIMGFLFVFVPLIIIEMETMTGNFFSEGPYIVVYLVEYLIFLFFALYHTNYIEGDYDEATNIFRYGIVIISFLHCIILLIIGWEGFLYIEFWPSVGSFFLGLIFLIGSVLSSFVLWVLEKIFRFIIFCIFSILEKIFGDGLKKKDDIKKYNYENEYKIALQIDKEAKKLSGEEKEDYLYSVYEKYEKGIADYNKLVQEYNQVIEDERNKIDVEGRPLYSEVSSLEREIRNINVLNWDQKNLDHVSKVIYVLEHRLANDIVEANRYIDNRTYWNNVNRNFMNALGSINSNLRTIGNYNNEVSKKIDNMNYNLSNNFDSRLKEINTRIEQTNNRITNQKFEFKHQIDVSVRN